MLKTQSHDSHMACCQHNRLLWYNRYCRQLDGTERKNRAQKRKERRRRRVTFLSSHPPPTPCSVPVGAAGKSLPPLRPCQGGWLCWAPEWGGGGREWQRVLKDEPTAAATTSEDASGHCEACWLSVQPSKEHTTASSSACYCCCCC